MRDRPITETVHWPVGRTGFRAPYSAIRTPCSVFRVAVQIMLMILMFVSLSFESVMRDETEALKRHDE